MSKTSAFNIKIDFDKSKGSYVFDKTTNKYYLDFMGMYSSLPIGYNHPVFDESFEEEVKRVSKLKIVNCEMLSDEYESFYEHFKNFTSREGYSNYAFTCTGALANEAAVKAAMWHKGPNPKGYVLSIKNSFHGINSVGNILTTRFQGVDIRQGSLPGAQVWPQVDSIEQAIKHIRSPWRNTSRIHGVIIEPIQSTYGDNYLPQDQLIQLRELCTEKDIPLIFDEVQTGFGVSGKVWYCDHLGIEPDIITFGKKSQVSGIMVKDSHNIVFEVPKRLSVTFDGDLLDMIRCKYIIKAIQKDNLLANATTMGNLLADGLREMPQIKNVRQIGLLLAFDFDTKTQRDAFVSKLHNNGMICNPTREVSIRMRPHLSTSWGTIRDALSLIRRSL
tara:strand:+ start:2040 stop:3203 length:1164 start_codon:yes stop_codon:yes gene_type:complete